MSDTPPAKSGEPLGSTPAPKPEPKPEPPEAKLPPPPPAPDPALTATQTQESEPDQAASQAKQASMPPPSPGPGPTVRGLATPMHAEPAKEVLAARVSPDPGRNGARIVQTTTPIIGPVEGNVAMPDTTTLIAYPWPQMGVADSFMVGHGVTPDVLSKAAEEWAKEHNPEAKFQAHQMGDGVRIWRLK